jgi:hypothetical protein
MDIFIKILILIWAISNLAGPVFYMAASDEKKFNIFLPITIYKQLRETYTKTGTIIAMTIICLWFSIVIAANIVMIIGMVLMAILCGWFYLLFRRKDK